MFEKKHLFAFYYIPKNYDEFVITNKDDLYNRIFLVLRMNVNDTYILFNNNYICIVKLVEVNKKYIVNKILEKKNNINLNKKIIAYIPCLERDYMNDVFYALGQQGVSIIQLIATDLSKIKEYNEKDYMRYEKLIIQGCEQAKQYSIPIFNKNYMNIDDLIKKNEIIYWFYEHGEKFSNVFLSEKIVNFDFGFFCGPERGFSQREIELLKNKKNFQSLKLSNFVLRSVDVIRFASILFQSI